MFKIKWYVIGYFVFIFWYKNCVCFGVKYMFILCKILIRDVWLEEDNFGMFFNKYLLLIIVFNFLNILEFVINKMKCVLLEYIINKVKFRIMKIGGVDLEVVFNNIMEWVIRLRILLIFRYIMEFWICNIV